MAQKKLSTHGVSAKEGRAWGHGQFANMPQEVVRKEYPKLRESADPAMNDTITGIDREAMKAHRTARKNLSNQH